MFLRHTLALAILAMLLFAPSAHAQEGALRIGICNPAKVLKALDEWKAFEDKMRHETDKLKMEQVSRKATVDEIIKQRNELKPESAQYKEKSKLAAEKAIEYDVWLQMTNLERARTQKEQIRALYDKIVEATKEVAEAKKLDFVLAERKPELPPEVDRLSPDDVLGALLQRDVLYSNDKCDITQAVILTANKKYAASVGAPAPAPASAAPAPK